MSLGSRASMQGVPAHHVGPGLIHAPRLVGRTIAGRYLVDRTVGSGAFAQVYECTDIVARDTVALKVLHPRHAGSRELVDRFFREARFALEVAHPGVARVLDHGVDSEGRAYIAMELLEGESLHALLERSLLGAPAVVEIGLQLLDILAAAHERGIVHRDVKPENVVLTVGPVGDMVVRLIDFGIAKRAARSHIDPQGTLDGVTLGTPHYMSPEQCMGKTIGPASDLWALGAVLFHALVGRPPFDDEQIGVLLQRIVTEDAPSIAAVRTDLPAALVRAIDGALVRSPSARWQDAAAMRRALTEG